MFFSLHIVFITTFLLYFFHMDSSEKLKVKRFTITERIELGKELIESAKPDHMYYVMLTLSAIIISAGVLVESPAVIIGGMLVAPLLTPILVTGYALAMQDADLAIFKGKLVLKSVGSILIGSFILGLLFATATEIPQLKDSLPAALLYFTVAFASGIAASYSWIHKESQSILPGIAIVASLAPPLAYAGISFASMIWQWNGELFTLGFNYIILFILNFIGIVAGSFIVFLLFGFNAMTQAPSELTEKKKQEEEPIKPTAVPMPESSDSAPEAPIETILKKTVNKETTPDENNTEDDNEDVIVH